MVIFTGTVMTLLAATILIAVLFLTTDWWEILAIVSVVGFVAYMAPDIAKAI